MVVCLWTATACQKKDLLTCWAVWNSDCYRVDATGIDAFDVVKLCSSLRVLLPLALAHWRRSHRRRQNSSPTAELNA